MTAPSRVAIVGAGPAGTRAAEVLVRAGLRPVLIDEAPGSGGRIYQRQPAGFQRGPRALYGFEARKARDLHLAMEALRGKLDYRPDTLVWDLRPARGGQPGMLHTLQGGLAGTVPFDQVILCPGAMDRVIPFPGWTLPGVYTLGGAQVALKSQGCTIGQRVAFLGTGPLLWLVAYQYARAGVEVAAVLDTTPFATKLNQASGLMRDVRTFAKGLYYVAALRARRIPIVEGATPEKVEGEDGVAALHWDDGRHGGRAECDAVAMGWGLKPETQLADLAGVPFVFDPVQRGWLPRCDAAGQTELPDVFLAGDGTRVAGADVAEQAGARAAWSVVKRLGGMVDGAEVARLDKALDRAARFRTALDRAFPFPHDLAAGMADDTVLCRCERITAGQLRASAGQEVNRAKALTRVGLGRCQGRVCGPPGAEVLAAALDVPLDQVGRLRGQAPVKPIPMQAAVAAE